MTGVARLVEDLAGENAQLRFESADALERHSRTSPQELAPYKGRLLGIMEGTVQAGVQWHLAQLMPRLALEAGEARQVAAILARWSVESRSSIVKADCLTAISHIAHQHGEHMPQAKLMLARALRHGTPAERARARGLIGRVGPPEA